MSVPSHADRRPGFALTLTLLLARVVVAAVMVLAGIVKISDPQQFAFSVKAFKILPDHLAVLATFVFPWLEVLCGVLMLLGLWTRAAALVAALQLAAFIGAILSVLARDMSVTCGCFGKYDLVCSGPLGWCNVAQNAVLLALALLVVARGAGRLAVTRD